MTQPIESVAIVGAGNMGSGIAQKTAQEMFQVQMVDREEKWVNRGQKSSQIFLRKLSKDESFPNLRLRKQRHEYQV